MSSYWFCYNLIVSLTLMIYCLENGLNATYCSGLVTKSYKREESEKIRCSFSKSGLNLNLGPSEWQPDVLTTTPCHICDIN